MFGQLFPQRIDNTYRGHKLALWLLSLVVLMKVGIGLNSILNGYYVASSADGIPLDTFTPAGARAVVSMFAIWGLCQLIFGLLCLLALIRYRALVPFMFALLLLEHLSRKLILLVTPIIKTGTPPGSVVNFVFLAVMIVGLALSLWSRDSLQGQEGRPLSRRRRGTRSEE